ncbi:MAG TPA: ATP-binding protein [Blastocatellia bacterium]|nr:ATP-binding protein [Blastocatellia bacterium]
MPGRIRFLLTFRARLMLLLTSFLLLTIVLVLALDKWAQKRADDEVARQSAQVREAFNTSFGDFAEAVKLALQRFNTEKYLYQEVPELPPTVQHIIVADQNGMVVDSDVREVVDKQITVPAQLHGTSAAQNLDPVEGEVQIHGGLIRTYNIPLTTAKGPYWVVIVMQQQAIINQIDTSSQMLASRNRQLSNYRLGATAGLLILALAIAVIIGWRFTRPINQLAGAAHRVAAGDLDFRVPVTRPDEIGKLASTFNEMIDGLRSKRELEEKLNQAERAAVIGRLTQAVAHEIRNPLNVINLSIDHVGSKFAPEDETRRRQLDKILASIKDEVARLKRLVNDLLNYGRPAQLGIGTVELRALVEETLALVRPQADEQHVRVSLEADGSPAEVRGDRERLKSCVSNLAINALQAMPGGGELIARVRRSDGAVELSISDTGVGISEEALSKVFEPYFSTKQTGFGLGLAVTKKIVEDHRGSIEVRSHLSRGTTFTVKLPSVER